MSVGLRFRTVKGLPGFVSLGLRVSRVTGLCGQGSVLFNESNQ